MSREEIIKEIENDIEYLTKNHPSEDEMLNMVLQDRYLILRRRQTKLKGYDLAVKEIREWLPEILKEYDSVDLSVDVLLAYFDKKFGGEK